jgi:hypothetical protein
VAQNNAFCQNTIVAHNDGIFAVLGKVQYVAALCWRRLLQQKRLNEENVSTLLTAKLLAFYK